MKPTNRKNAGPSNEHIKRITKQRMNAVQKLPRGLFMAAAGNIDEPSGDIDFEKKLRPPGKGVLG
jgi:hypothetical protein